MMRRKITLARLLLIVIVMSGQMLTASKSTSLHKAAKRGDIIKIRSLIEKEVSLTNRDKEGNTPLHIALINNHEEAALEIINALKEAQNNKTSKKKNLLSRFFKSKEDHTSLDKNNKGQKELTLAVMNNLNDAVKEIIDLAKQDASVDFTKYMNESDSALHLPIFQAIRVNNLWALEYLLSQGANVPPEALFWINWNDYSSSDIAKTLLNYGINPNTNTNLDRHTALHRAVIAENQKAIKLLLEAGARIDIKDNRNKTAMDYAYRDDIKDLLINWNSKDQERSAMNSKQEELSPQEDYSDDENS